MYKFLTFKIDYIKEIFPNLIKFKEIYMSQGKLKLILFL